MPPFVSFQRLKKGQEEGLPVVPHQIAVLQTLTSSHMLVKNISQEIGSIGLCS